MTTFQPTKAVCAAFVCVALAGCSGKASPHTALNCVTVCASSIVAAEPCSYPSVHGLHLNRVTYKQIHVESVPAQMEACGHDDTGCREKTTRSPGALSKRLAHGW